MTSTQRNETATSQNVVGAQLLMTSHAGSATSSSPRLSTLAPFDAHRRRRTAFTSDQLLELEKEFHSKKYLSLTERSQLAHDLQLSEVPLPLPPPLSHVTTAVGCRTRHCYGTSPVCNVKVSWSHKLEFFPNNVTVD